MSWVAAAIAGGAVVGGVAKAVTGNQTKQRNKGFIDQNYRLAEDRLQTNQKLVRQNTSEDLVARGLSPVAGAMMGTSGATALGGRVQQDTEHQLDLERQDLDNQHNQALANNKADYTNTLVNAGVGVVNGAMSAYGAHEDAGAFRSPGAATPVRSAMLSGSQIGVGGADVIDPLGHPDSSWFRGGNGGKMTLNGAGLSNAEFNSGNT